MYYDIIEQGRYFVKVKPIEDLTEVSDVFYTFEEMQEICDGGYLSHTGMTIRHFDSLITAELEKWAAKLDESGKKTVRITDQELVDVLKNNPNNTLSHYAGKEYMRRGDRICYYKRRKKTKPTRGDLRTMWDVLTSGFKDKTGGYLPHIPGWCRNYALFVGLQGIVGYNTARKYFPDDNAKFLRQIWYNPKEYF